MALDRYFLWEERFDIPLPPPLNRLSAGLRTIEAAAAANSRYMERRDGINAISSRTEIVRLRRILNADKAAVFLSRSQHWPERTRDGAPRGFALIVASNHPRSRTIPIRPLGCTDTSR